MEAWKKDPNKRAIAIVRRSGYNQKENTSGDTQDREIRALADFVERSQAISLNGSTRFHGSEPPNFIQRIHL